MKKEDAGSEKNTEAIETRHEYEAPAIETVISAKELEREVHYAGLISDV